jgi:hypothetical protein
VLTAQLELALVLISANETPLGMVTATGTLLAVVVLLPSWPEEFAPQQ